MPRDAQSAAARVQALKARRPGAFQLARVLSLAARIEFRLLRLARQLLPNVDASAEADLCASEIAVSQTPQGFMLDTYAADVLRRDLASDAALLERAWQLVAFAHRDAPWPVRSEEHINWLCLSGNDAAADRIQQILLAGAREMVQANDRVAAARWMMRALMRLPPGADSDAGRAIEAGVAMQLDGRLNLDAAKLPADAFENWFPWLLPSGGPSVDVAVSLLDGFLELGRSDASGVAIAIPDTKPLVVDLSWHDGLHAGSERVAFEKTEWRQVRITSQEVELRTLDGRRYRVRARADARVGGGGIDFSAIRARHRPFVGRAKELGELSTMLPPSRSESVALGIVGERGIGKTALLCRGLEELEERGARVLVHFVEGGPEAWRSPAMIEASLRAQMADWPSTSTGAGGAATLLDELARHTPGGPIYILLDGFDAERDGRLIQWRTELVKSAPRSVNVAWTESRRRSSREEPPRPGINLDDRQSSNQAVCQEYMQLNGAALDASTQALLVRRAAGNIGRMVAMIEWIEKSTEPVNLNLMPPVLYGGFEQVWSELVSAGDRGGELELTAATIAAAREPIPRRYLLDSMALSEMADPEAASRSLLKRLESAGLVTLIRADAMVPDVRALDEHVTLSHNGLREMILAKVGAERLRSIHALLAEWRQESPYWLRHSLSHLIDAGQIDQAIARVSDLGFLTQVCNGLGVDSLEAQLADAAERTKRS